MTKKKIPPERAAFVALLLAVRKELGVTQLGLAAFLGVSKNTVNRWEVGLWMPSRAAQTNLLDCLGDAVSKPLLSRLARAMLADPTQPAYVEPVAPRAADPATARAALDARVLAGAEALDTTPAKIRAMITDVLAAVEALGLDAKTARELVAKKPA